MRGIRIVRDGLELGHVDLITHTDGKDLRACGARCIGGRSRVARDRLRAVRDDDHHRLRALPGGGIQLLLGACDATRDVR
jgi:hypothetical protein